MIQVKNKKPQNHKLYKTKVIYRKRTQKKEVKIELEYQIVIYIFFFHLYAKSFLEVMMRISELLKWKYLYYFQ